MLTFLVVSYFFGWVGGGWGGVVGEVRDKAISTQVVVEVEVGVELGKKLFSLKQTRNIFEEKISNILTVLSLVRLGPKPLTLTCPVWVLLTVLRHLFSSNLIW